MQITVDDALARGGTGRFQWRLLGIFGLVWAADAMQVIAVGFAWPSVAASFGVERVTALQIGTLFFLGMFVGAYGFGRIADRIGRRKVLLLTVAMDAIFGLASVLANDFTFLLAMRFMTGVAVGGTLPVDYAMMAEFLPPKNRGRWLVILEGFWAVGTVVVALTACTASLAGVAELSQTGVVTGKSAMTYLWSNQLVGVQGLMEDKLGVAMYPNTAEMIPGSIVQPSQFVCLTRDSVDPEAATTYMSAFVNDIEMTQILGLERGIPSQSDVRAALQPQLTEVEALSVEFFDKIQGKTAPLGPPPPSGANEVEQTFERLAVAVLLKERTIPEVAADFMQQAQAILARA